jgi:hypothetical protein
MSMNNPTLGYDFCPELDAMRTIGRGVLDPRLRGGMTIECEPFVSYRAILVSHPPATAPPVALP